MKPQVVNYVISLVIAVNMAAQPLPSYAQHVVHQTATLPAKSAVEIWTDLMRGNQRFVEGKPQTREFVTIRKSLAKSQRPNVVVLTCSDSRVSPELIFDKSLGDLFVVRTAGNVADAIGVGSIEYAVEQLKSSVLVVLGHTQCGAVKWPHALEKKCPRRIWKRSWTRSLRPYRRLRNQGLKTMPL